MPARKQLVHHDTKREQIRLRRDRLASELFGRHVKRRAQMTHNLRVPHIHLSKHRDAKIANFYLTVFPNKDVLRLDVAVDHAFAMSIIKRDRALEQQIDHALDVKKGMPVGKVVQGTAPWHEFHHDVAYVPIDARIEYLDDIWMLEHARRFRLVEEQLSRDARALVIFATLRIGDLNRHFALAERVPGTIYARHSPRAEVIKQLVLTNGLPNQRRSERVRRGCRHRVSQMAKGE